MVAVNEEEVRSLGGGVLVEGFLDSAEKRGGNGGMRGPDAEVSEMKENVCGLGVRMREDTTSLTGVSVPVSDESDSCVHGE